MPWTPNESSADGSMTWSDFVMNIKTPKEAESLRKKTLNKKTVWNPFAAALSKKENGFSQRVITPQKQKEKRRATKPKFGVKEWLEEERDEE